ncbi:MAG: hypothetical protein DRP42_04355 [Tenericutes bacterium]|nr:MAG: hypothetical protein DRP42_04355 [Mycoplasmatota bacterium]
MSIDCSLLAGNTFVPAAAVNLADDNPGTGVSGGCSTSTQCSGGDSWVITFKVTCHLTQLVLSGWWEDNLNGGTQYWIAVKNDGTWYEGGADTSTYNGDWENVTDVRLRIEFGAGSPSGGHAGGGATGLAAWGEPTGGLVRVMVV